MTRSGATMERDLHPSAPRLPERLIVTIDGPAGTGKSSVARRVARTLGLEFLDTGAMYRGATVLAIDAEVDLRSPEDAGERIAGLIDDADLRFDFSTDPPSLIAGRDVIDDRLRSAQVSTMASPVSMLAPVRHALVERQRRIAEVHPRLVSEGRDQGSFVFPRAEVKFFLHASIRVRARRRHEQLLAQGKPSDLHEVEREIAERDRRDSERPLAPLVHPQGAVDVDTSELTIDQVVERLASIVLDAAGNATRVPR